MVWNHITQEHFDACYGERRLIHSCASYWAARKPDSPAVINATRDTTITWTQLDKVSRALAGYLERLGLRKGDRVAVSLPLLNELILLEYACFRAGVVLIPLDLRLHPAEVLRCLGLTRPKVFACLGKTPDADFGALASAVKQHCSFIEHLWMFCPPEQAIEGAQTFAAVMAEAIAGGWETTAVVEPGDGAVIIFTTGSTGSPKPALLTHEGTTAQNLCLGTGFDFNERQRVMVNLPASHVGCQNELLMTCLFMGGTVVSLEIFDAGKTLEAIEKYKVTLLGQIPAMFHMLWRHPDYGKRDLSSLKVVVYGGQSVPRPFLEKLRTMAPLIGTGLGLTETTGFCTYTPLTGDVDEIAAGIGYSMPIYPMTIREAMRGDGLAGAELAEGQIGHVCFKGIQTFDGYVNDPAATAAAASKDGYLYTGDLGWVDGKGLHFSGRAKFVIKPAGNQVFPGDIEEHFAKLTDKVGGCGVVGVEHALWSEAVVAFVEKLPGVDLTEVELRRHARGLTSYMRPLHYVILEPGTLPLNRVAKVDAMRLKDLALEEVRRLRERGRWDRQPVENEDTILDLGAPAPD
ncbi:MAG TPA: class I adenylate-forming enzyme family protein [Bryobacteraceae bacterium]|nr:class I adenylate-forming enzyme family protein [Bryobacteraceae bacterium]